MNLQARYDLEIEKDRLGTALDELHPLSAATWSAWARPAVSAT